MKMISAVVKPLKVDDVRAALTGIGVEGLTVSEVKGYGRQKGQTEIYRGAEYAVHFLPKIRIDVAVDDRRAKDVIEVIQSAAATGRIGDGKILVSDLSHVVRIRTGEINAEAI